MLMHIRIVMVLCLRDEFCVNFQLDSKTSNHFERVTDHFCVVSWDICVDATHSIKDQKTG